MKATDLYFSVAFFIMFYKVYSTVSSVDEILKCEANRSHQVELSFGAVNFTIQVGSS